MSPSVHSRISHPAASNTLRLRSKIIRFTPGTSLPSQISCATRTNAPASLCFASISSLATIPHTPSVSIVATTIGCVAHVVVARSQPRRRSGC